MRRCFCCCPKGRESDLEVELTSASLLQYLRKVPLIKRLHEDDFPLVASVSKACVFFAGEEIVRQNDLGHEFFIICEGEASVTVRDDAGVREVVKLGEGDYFGENALLHEEYRMATVTAATQMLTLKITREDFVKLGLNKKLHFAHRRAVHTGGRDAEVEIASFTKTPEERLFIANALRSYENLQTLLANKDSSISELIEVARKEVVKAGKEIIVEGDLHANDFYVIQSGDFHVILPVDGVGRATIGGVRMVTKSIGAGKCFGELALMYLTPRTATVVATTDAVLWAISRQHFKRILLQASNEIIDEYVKLLDSVHILDCLFQDEKRDLAGALVEMQFSKDDVVLRQGDSGNTFYILYEGEVSVQRAGEEIKRLCAGPGAAQYFGEKALLGNDLRTATIQVTSNTASALVLDRESFDLLLGPLGQLMDSVKSRRKSSHGNRARGETGFEDFHHKSTKKAIPWSELKRVRKLGQGSFGIVEMYLHSSGKVYALKSCSKSKIKEMCLEKAITNERDVLFRINSPFVIGLYATYNKNDQLSFLLEFAPGGELYDLYIQMNLFGQERYARFYLSAMILALEHMHKLRIVNRDVKPDNVVLNDHGYPKLIDMGMAKFLVGKTYTTCGTPDYFAPELITTAGHSFGVDWWSLGVVLFELMAGPTPFAAPDPIAIFKKVLKGIEAVPFPPKMAGGVTERLIKTLLKQRPSERLPMRMGGVQNVKNHQWFVGFDWASLQSLDMKPPYIPRTKNALTSYASQPSSPLDGSFAAGTFSAIPYEDDGSGWDDDFATDS